jgi:hypothetical protein
MEPNGPGSCFPDRDIPVPGGEGVPGVDVILMSIKNPWRGGS